MIKGYAQELIFFAFSAAFVVVAFRPTWLEWRHPTDIDPLQVPPNYSSDIDYFSDQFKSAVTTRLSGNPSAIADGFDFARDNLDAVNWAQMHRPLICLTSACLQGAVDSRTTLFVNGDFRTTLASRFSALFVKGGMSLAGGSEIREWAHADGPVSMGEGCMAPRRLSSASLLELAKDCCFERLQAPVVRLGTTADQASDQRLKPLTEGRLSALDGAIRQTDGLTLVRGNCKLPRFHRYHGSLIVTGRLSVGEGTEIFGDVKARAGVVVGARAWIHGALCSEHQVQLLERSRALGPVMSESAILLGPMVCLGEADAPTTVCAVNIMAEAGAVVHGTVWAREGGVVWAI